MYVRSYFLYITDFYFPEEEDESSQTHWYVPNLSEVGAASTLPRIRPSGAGHHKRVVTDPADYLFNVSDRTGA